MYNKNFSKEIQDEFDEKFEVELSKSIQHLFYGFTDSNSGIAEGIPFLTRRHHAKSIESCIEFAETITKKQKVIFGGVELNERFDPILDENIPSYILHYSVLYD